MEMNVSVRDVDLQLMFCCRLFVVQSFSLLSVGGKKEQNPWLFKKMLEKKLFGKKDVFFLLVLLYIVYTNYYEY